MHIRLWNAFASNNSGSYTIVGSFLDPASAARAAKELAELCDAEQRWRQATAADTVQPLAEFARRHGLPFESGRDEEDWPEYGAVASVAETGRQVVVHCSYTVTMPRLLGAFLYACGGRVDTEIGHAHHAIVVDAQFWPLTRDRQENANGLLAELTAPDNALSRLAAPDVHPIARGSNDWHEPPVRVLTVFADLVAGVQALATIGHTHGLQLQVRCLEAEPGDPLRPWR